MSEFLQREALSINVPLLNARAIVHDHCHHKALLGMGDEECLLARLGLDVDILDSGCRGMARSFGFERDKFAVSMKIGEPVLLPAVRAAGADTLIVVDGFSCREQIAQAISRRALHTAQIVQMAMARERLATPPHRRVEQARASSDCGAQTRRR